jgi:lipopolysaccharide export system permease protein
MRLVHRHILSSLAGPFVFAWIALTGMLMLNQLAKRFGSLVGKGLPPEVITEVLILFIPFIVALTLPMAVLVAVLYGFTQMGADNELTAMRATGVSVLQMLRPVLAAGVLLTLANFFFVDQVLPKTNLRLLNLQVDIARKKPTFRLVEQVLNDLSPSLYWIQASRIEPGTGRMREVAIYDMSVVQGRRIIYADSGYMTFQGEKDLGILLFDGTVHEFKSGEPATVRVTGFSTNSIRVKDIQNALEVGAGSVQKGDREMTTCEMMDRVESGRRTVARAQRNQRSLTVNDLRALLHVTPAAEPSPAPRPYQPACSGTWRKLEGLMSRLLLPQKASAQAPVDSLGRTPADSAAIRVQLPNAFAAEPILTAITEITTAREEEVLARQEVSKFGVEIHKKYTLSIACFNFVLIGIALALRFPRGGIGLVIGGSLAIFALFYVGLTGGEGLADKGRIDPALAMWLPNLIVLVLGLLGLVRVNKEFGSTRGGDLSDLGELLFGWARRRRG